MRRRTYVAMVGTGALAGCVGQRGETTEEGTDGQEPTEQSTEQPTEETDSVGFQKLWENDLEDANPSSSDDVQLAADEETAYLGTKSELTALSLADGTEQWTLSLDTELAGVTIDDDGLYTLQDRTVQRIDPATGESRWAESAGAGTVQREGTNQGTVATTEEHVAAAGAGGVIVFEKASGELTAVLTERWGDPVRAWNGQFVVADDSTVTAYDPDGTAQWTIDDVPLTWSAPVAGSTFVGGDGKTFVGIDLDSGTQAWTTEVSNEFVRPLTAGTDDTVFLYPVFSAYTFYALDADTGAVRWKNDDSTSLDFPPVVLESAVLIPEVWDDLDEGVQACKPKTGEQIASSDEFDSFRGATGSGRTIVNYDERAVAYRL